MTWKIVLQLDGAGPRLQAVGARGAEALGDDGAMVAGGAGALNG